MLSVDDYHGLYAIIPTPTRADAAWGGDNTVDLDETARVVDTLIKDGASGLIALGTTGECATLGSNEYESVVRCITETVAGRVPTMIGSTAMAWADIRQRLTVLKDAGASGTLLGLPMWQPMTADMAVEMYAQTSIQFPDLAVMVYANERAFRFPFATSPDFWGALVDRAPTATSAKFSQPKTLASLREATGGRIHFMPNESRVRSFLPIAGDSVTSCWATAASMGPEPCLALMDALTAGDTARADQVAADIAWTNEPIDGLLQDLTLFASYNIQIEKTRINAAGYCAAGPIRAPYNHFPEEYATRATECGTRWQSIREKYVTRRSTDEVTEQEVGS